MARQQYAIAEQPLHDALQIFEADPDTPQDLVVQIRLLYAECLRELGRRKEADKLERDARALEKRLKAAPKP